MSALERKTASSHEVSSETHPYQEVKGLKKIFTGTDAVPRVTFLFDDVKTMEASNKAVLNAYQIAKSNPYRSMISHLTQIDPLLITDLYFSEKCSFSFALGTSCPASKRTVHYLLKCLGEEIRAVPACRTERHFIPLETVDSFD